MSGATLAPLGVLLVKNCNEVTFYPTKQVTSSAQFNRTRHIFLAYGQPRRIIFTLAIASLLLVGLYFYIGRMTLFLWVMSAGVVIAFVMALKQLSQRGPCIIVNEVGIDDKRLGLGIIRWTDIEGVRMHGVAGAYFISLDVSNAQQYLARQPAYIRLSNQLWRMYDVSPIHIKVAYMDVTPDELFEMIMSEVELSRSRS